MPADYALVSLERAVLDLAAGRRAEVRVLAEELSWLFAHQGLAPEALAALAVFRAAVAQERATADLARRLVRRAGGDKTKAKGTSPGGTERASHSEVEPTADQ